MRVRTLTPAGMDVFRSFLARARSGSTELAPVALLESSAHSAPLPEAYGACDVGDAIFASKSEVVKYLFDSLAKVPREYWRHEMGLWAWLALWRFEQLAPRSTAGTRKLLADELYIPSVHFQRRYRHLLLGPYLVYTIQQERARLLLAKPINVWSDVEEQLIGVQDIIQIPGALEAADLLYFDAEKMEAKRGITNRKKGGTIRRLREVLQQLDLTFDVNALSGREIVALLPGEFDRFRPASSDSTVMHSNPS